MCRKGIISRMKNRERESMDSKVLFINACVREASRTKRLADKLLTGLNEPYEEVCLKDITFPVTNEEFLKKRDQLISDRDFQDPMFDLAKLREIRKLRHTRYDRKKYNRTHYYLKGIDEHCPYRIKDIIDEIKGSDFRSNLISFIVEILILMSLALSGLILYHSLMNLTVLQP